MCCRRICQIFAIHNRRRIRLRRRLENDIIAEVLTSGRGYLIGIGPTIKKSVREQAKSSQQSASSQSSVSFNEFQALQRKLETMEQQVMCMYKYNFMSRKHPESV